MSHSELIQVPPITQVPSQREQRRERLRRKALNLALPAGAVPSILRGYLERSLDAIYDDSHRYYHFYLFSTRDTLLECQMLCSTAIRRSVVPVELHAKLPLWGGTWCAELEIPRLFLPMLGTGIGGLTWDEVERSLLRADQAEPDVELIVVEWDARHVQPL